MTNSLPSQPQRILIVDDEPANINLLAGALENEYELQFALSGELALDLIKQHAPDLVLLDVMMAGMDGLDTLRCMMASDWCRDVPVILITADNRSSTHVEGLELGAQDFLLKPIDLTILRARVSNVMERRRLQREGEQLLERLDAAHRELVRLSTLNSVLLASAGEGIYSVDLNSLCTSANPAATRMLGYAENEILGQNTHALFHQCGQEKTPDLDRAYPVLQTLQDGKIRSVEDSFVRKDGTSLPVLLTVTPMVQEGVFIGAEVLFHDISERQRMERELLRLATTDPLTGISNRRRFFELSEAERMRVGRYHTNSAVLMLDLDHFKHINDGYGHAVGDATLIQFSSAISRLLRTVDIFGRIGGEEFAIVLPETDSTGAIAFAERLRQAVAGIRVPAGESEITFTVSIGVTTLRGTDETFDQALARADTALYRAKKSGRNQSRLEN